MSNLTTTRKLSKNEAKQIVESALERLNARETRLPDRIWAWCVANFNPEKENMVESVYEEILKAATTGEGSDYSIGIANMIIEKHEYLTATRNVSTCFEPVTHELNCISLARGNVGKFTPDSRVV